MLCRSGRLSTCVSITRTPCHARNQSSQSLGDSKPRNSRRSGSFVPGRGGKRTYSDRVVAKAGYRRWLEDCNTSKIVLFKLKFPANEHLNDDGGEAYRFQEHGLGFRQLCETVLRGEQLRLRVITMRHNAGAVLFHTESQAKEVCAALDGASVGDFLSWYSDIPIRAALKAAEDPVFTETERELEKIATYRECRQLLRDGFLQDGMQLWLQSGAPISLVHTLISAHRAQSQIPEPMDHLRHVLRWASELRDGLTQRRLEQRDDAYAELIEMCASLREHQLLDDLLEEMEHLDVKLPKSSKQAILSARHEEVKTASHSKDFCARSSIFCNMHKLDDMHAEDIHDSCSDGGYILGYGT